MGRNYSKEREKDKISKNQRSKVMSKIRSKNTYFEEQFISGLKKLTRKHFKRNFKDLKGKPDIVFFKYKICVFLDSDFWHGWQFPRWKHLLKNDFWREKINKNRIRDKRTTFFLRRKGWTVIRIWEHSIKKETQKQYDKILEALERNNK